eukprot:gene16660-34677_t
MRATLKELNVDIITCEEEADQEIAKACASINGDSTSGDQYCYCYANDSDFLLMKDCPYVTFGSLSKPMGYSDGCMARVWRRSELAGDLGLSESQFVELALLIGNDFTGVFPRSQLQLHIETSSCSHFPGDEDYSKDAIDAMVEYIQSLPDDYQLTSSNTSLQTALEYSRALYELGDILNYPEDSKHIRLMALCDEQLDSIRTYVKGRVGMNNDKTLVDDDVASIAIDYLYAFLEDGDGSELGEDLYSIPLDNVQSLETMVQKLTSVMEMQEEEEGDDGMESVSLALDKKEKALVDDTFPPQWNDVIAAHQYQLICKEIFKCIRKNITATTTSNNSKLTEVTFQPRRCFNGIMYHTLRFEHHEKMNEEEEHQQQMDNENGSYSDNNNADEDVQTNSDGNGSSNALPIDAFREEILHRVNRDRVT